MLKILRPILIIFLLELISYLSYYYPLIREVGFFVIIGLVLILSLKDLKYGLFVVLAELIIGSKGYLFYFEIFDFTISIRIALWLLIMAVSLGFEFYSLYGKKTFKLAYPKIYSWKNNIFPWFLLLFIFIFWGIINGILLRNNLANIFFDANGWLYFALLFPIYRVFSGNKSGEIKHAFLNIFFVCVTWLTIKTLALLFIFSHFNPLATFDLYRWIRESGVGEITRMPSGYYRIFFQSHIYVLIGFIISWLLFLYKRYGQKNLNTSSSQGMVFWIFSIMLLAVNFITLSRSNWVGLAAGIVLINIFAAYKFKFKILFYSLVWLAAAGIIGALMLPVVVKFPFPVPSESISTSGLLSERAGQLSGEAGASSRWKLLRVLTPEIREAWVMGKGFGATVTYKSEDPRVLENSPEGDYTTFAFEWGYLDIWLKLGIFGLVSYLLLLAAIFRKGVLIYIKENNSQGFIFIGFIIGLISLCAVNVFSPYLNHPLGIGYVIIVAAVIDSNMLKYQKSRARNLI